MKKIKLCTLLLVVILNLMFVSSCYVGYHPSKAYETGALDIRDGMRHNLHVKSDTDIFDINELKFETYIGVRAIEYYYKGNDLEYLEYFDPDLTIPCYTNGTITPVSISINYISFEYVLNEEQNGLDLKILNEGILKNLDSKEILDGKYTFTFTDDYRRDLIYKYSEYLTIPKECFNRDSGEFCIGVKINNKYSDLIHFFYEMIDENTVQIQFDYEDFKNISKSSIQDHSINDIKKYYAEKYNEEQEGIE